MSVPAGVAPPRLAAALAPAFVGPFAAELYEALAPLAWADAANGWALAGFVAAVAEPFAQVDQLARDAPPDAGWTILVDPDRVPAEGLPWLAQLVGAVDDAALPEAERRARIRRLDGTKRGTPDAMRAAVQPLLTGNRTVILRERAGGDPYALSVVTWTSETPDQPAVLRALLRQKPAGIVLTYSAEDQWDYTALAAAQATYTALAGAYATYDALTGG